MLVKAKKFLKICLIIHYEELLLVLSMWVLFLSSYTLESAASRLNT